MRPRILWCGEFSQLKTGYSVYAHEVLTRWFNTKKYDIAEQCCYAHQSDPRLQNVPWVTYCNLPDSNNEEQKQKYASSPTAQFGDWRFEEICLDFRPHFVIDIRDMWMMSHEFRSPYRPYYNHVIMPTCDAYPQNEEWISSYASADGVFTYQDWSKQVLDFESAGKIKTLGSASPAAAPEFQPMDKESIKKSVGLENYKIIGAVMRNQRRKLFPDLFGAFKIFLEQTKRSDILLYCHTSYPDMGWDFPKLLLQYGLASKVLFTYTCRECGHTQPEFFNDALMNCKKCGKLSASVVNVQQGVDNKVLAAIYNMFDLYIQWANCLVPGQPIKTSTGWKNIEDIQIGELVLTHTGQYQKVTNTFKHKNNNQVYKIDVYGDCEKLQLTAEHPVYIVDREKVLQNDKNSLREVLGTRIENRKNSKYEIPLKFIEAKHLQKGDLIAEKIDENELNVYKIDLGWFLDNNKLCCKPNYIYNENTIAIRTGDFYNRYIEVDNDFCRFFGLYMADGTSSYDKSNKNIRICSHINETKNIKLSKKVLQKISGKEPSIRGYKNRQAVNIESYSALHGAFFKQFGKLENKAFPEWVLKLPIEKQKNIVHGMFMGDGCYRKETNISIYTTISYELASQLRQLLQRIGITYSVNRIIKSGNRKLQYRFEVKGNIKEGEFNCDRSNTRSLNYNGYYIRQVSSIATIDYDGFVYNIEVENDNSYTSKIGVVHNSEGFSLPVIEAASCGVPVITVDYSALSDNTRKIGGVPIKPLSLYMELETGCFRAVPNNDKLIDKMIEFFSMEENTRLQLRNQTRQAYLQHYSWDKTAQKWINYFDKVNVEEYESRWNSEPSYINIPNDYPRHLSNVQFARWLITNILGEPRYINSYMESRLIRDLNYEVTNMGIAGMYFNDQSSLFTRPNWQSFNQELAFKHFVELGKRRNYWENMRWKKIQQLRNNK